MASLTTRNPRTSLFDELFRDFPFGYSVKPLHGDALPTPDQIKVELKESDDAVTVKAEIPGVKKDDIGISVDNGVLTIEAEIRQEDKDTDANEGKVIHSERYYGSVSRSFRLPTNVSPDDASADYRDGMLVLTLPKKATDRSKRIAVK